MIIPMNHEARVMSVAVHCGPADGGSLKVVGGVGVVDGAGPDTEPGLGLSPFSGAVIGDPGPLRSR